MNLPWQKQKTLEEAQQENERLDVELSIAQKRAMLAKLKANGLTTRDFGGSLKKAWQWFKTH